MTRGLYQDSKTGFPLVAYHGTCSPVDFKDFVCGGVPDEIDDSGSGDPSAFIGSHFTNSCNVADMFAMRNSGWLTSRYTEKGEAGPRVIPVYLRMSNPAKFASDEDLRSFILSQPVDYWMIDGKAEQSSDPEAYFARYDSDASFREEENQDIIEKSRILDVNDVDTSFIEDLAFAARTSLERRGHDGIIHKNTVEGGTSYIVFQPKQVVPIYQCDVWDLEEELKKAA